MTNKTINKVAIVVPNWNGEDFLARSLNSLGTQTHPNDIIVVDNGSHDSSTEIIERDFPEIKLIRNKKNIGFAAGVNQGIMYARDLGYDAVALFNNDAQATNIWLQELVKAIEKQPDIGIVTCKLLNIQSNHLDSTGENYSIWGIPFPRGRDETTSDKYDNDLWIFGASGGASIYRMSMLREIGLFDEDFFAYYEDVDISFRAQLAGWKVRYEPAAVALHATSSTGSKLPGFFTYQTIKNYPFIFWKNVPLRLFPVVLPRFTVAYIVFTLKGLFTPSRAWPTLKGLVVTTILLPKKLFQRWHIQRSRKVSTTYIASILTWDLPPNAHKLRALRSRWWRIVGKR